MARTGMWYSAHRHQQNRDKMCTRWSAMRSAFQASWYRHGREAALSSCSGITPRVPHPGLMGLGTRSFYFPQPPTKDPFLVAMLSREFSGVWCLLVRISSRGGEKDDSATAESSLTHSHHPNEVEPASLVTLVPSPASSRTRCGMVSKHPWLIHLGKKLEMCSGLVMGCLRGFLLNYSSQGTLQFQKCKRCAGQIPHP